MIHCFFQIKSDGFNVDVDEFFTLGPTIIWIRSPQNTITLEFGAVSSWPFPKSGIHDNEQLPCNLIEIDNEYDELFLKSNLFWKKDVHLIQKEKVIWNPMAWTQDE